MKTLHAVCIHMTHIYPIGANYKRIAVMARVTGTKIIVIAHRIVALVEMANVRAGTMRIVTLAHRIVGIV